MPLWVAKCFLKGAVGLENTCAKKLVDFVSWAALNNNVSALVCSVIKDRAENAFKHLGCLGVDESSLISQASLHLSPGITHRFGKGSLLDKPRIFPIAMFHAVAIKPII